MASFGVLLSAVLAVSPFTDVKTIAVSPFTDVKTNVCNLDWYYCPRDPGCVTYTMSVHEVFVRDANITSAMTAMQLKAKDTMLVEIKGETSLATVPLAGSFKIYNLAGDTTFSGDLSKAMTITGTAKPFDFTLEIEFPLTQGSFDTTSDYFEFGVDVFQASSGADEGMCIEIANVKYTKYEQNKPNPPGPAFNMLCDDNGDGTFTKHVKPDPVHLIPSPGCGDCDLDWYYCPRDPGCVTYTMSVESVTFDDAAAGPLAAKDQVRLLVNGTTSLSEVPHYGTFVIYELSGGEIMQGELRKNNYMTITPVAGEKWSKFALDIPFTLAAGAFQTPYFEIGLDIFQGSQGDNEGMCIEVANPPYVKYEQDKPSPPGKPFVQFCKDMGHGVFKNETLPEVIHQATCQLSTNGTSW